MLRVWTPLRTSFVLSVALASLVLPSSTARAHDGVEHDPRPGRSLNLRDLLPNLLRNGLVLSPQGGHEAHFLSEGSAQFQAIEVFNDLMAQQIANYPLPSSAGGFAYEFDPATGLLERPTQSFGSVYMDRPYTVGEGRFNLGLSFNRISFDTVDGLEIRDGDVRLVMTHTDPDDDGPLNPDFEGDVITGPLFLDLNTDITTLVLNYGVTPSLDIGMAIPMVETSLGMSMSARVQELGSTAGTHVFTNGTVEDDIQINGTRSGVGDVTLRGKWVFATGQVRSGFTLDVRLPTGDERNLLGAGAYEGKALWLASVANEKSALRVHVGGSVANETLPDQFLYAVGADVAVDPKLTLAADLLGRYVIDQQRIEIVDEDYAYQTTGGGTAFETYETLTVEAAEESYNSLSLAAGLKVNVYRSLLVSVSGLAPLTDRGMTDDFSALLGLDYSF